MKKLSHLEKLLEKKTVCILLVSGESEEGIPLYAYVAVRADKLEEFMEAQNSGIFYPEEFGVIVEQGEGTPSAEVRKKMEVEYGFCHETMIDIPDADEAAVAKMDMLKRDPDHPDYK